MTFEINHGLDFECQVSSCVTATIVEFVVPVQLYNVYMYKQTWRCSQHGCRDLDRLSVRYRAVHAATDSIAWTHAEALVYTLH